jgi:Yip1 domain
MVFDDTTDAWKSALFSPGRFFSGKTKVDSSLSLCWVIGAALLVFLCSSLVIGIGNWPFNVLSVLSLDQAEYIIYMVAFLSVLFYLVSALVFAAAGYMGGKGSILRQAGLMSAYTVPLFLAYSFLSWVITFFSGDYLPLALLVIVSLAYTYFTYLLVRSEHKLHAFSSLVAAVIPLVLLLAWLVPLMTS